MDQRRKLFYTEPTLEMLTLNVADVISTSGFEGQDDPLIQEP